MNKVDIFSYDELKNTDTEQTYLKMQKVDFFECIHILLALKGAICSNLIFKRHQYEMDYYVYTSKYGFVSKQDLYECFHIYRCIIELY